MFPDGYGEAESKKDKQVIPFCFICGLHSHRAVHKDISKHFSFVSNCETRWQRNDTLMDLIADTELQSWNVDRRKWNSNGLSPWQLGTLHLLRRNHTPRSKAPGQLLDGPQGEAVFPPADWKVKNELRAAILPPILKTSLEQPDRLRKLGFSYLWMEQNYKGVPSVNQRFNAFRLIRNSYY